MHKEPWLFLFDIDLTLYDPDLPGIPQSTQDALHRLAQEGHKLYICTSRSISELANVDQILKALPIEGAIFSGGGCIYKEHELIYVDYLNPEDVESLFEYINREHISTRWQTPHKLYFQEKPDGSVYAFLDELFGEVPEVRPWDGEPIIRLMLYATEAQRAEMEKIALRSRVIRLSKMATSILPADVDKGKGARILADYLGIPMERVAAFGDGENDASMLAAAGVGIAMGGSDEEAIEAADYVTASIKENGIFEACRHFGWISEKI